MKYMVVGNPNLTPIPLEHAVNLYKAAMAWTDERIKNGMIDCHYVYVGGGGFTIGNANSQEELFDELLSYPLYAFFDWEVEPLVDWKHAYNSVIEFYKKMGVK